MKCSLPFREDLKFRDIVSGLKCQSILKVFFCRFGCGICDCNLGFFPDAQSSKSTCLKVEITLKRFFADSDAEYVVMT